MAIPIEVSVALKLEVGIPTETRVGHTEVGTIAEVVGEFYPFGNVHTFPEAGKITKLYAYLDSPNDGNSQVMRAIVYPADSSGVPVHGSEARGVSTQVTIADNTPAQWIEFTFPTPISVTAGEKLLIGLWAGSTNIASRLYKISSNPAPSANYYYNNGGYSSTNPPGTWNGSTNSPNGSWSIYVEFDTDAIFDDNFNRPNETPIASPWVNGIYSGESLNLSGNRLDRGGGWGSAYYGARTYGPDVETRVTIASPGAIELAFRITTPGAAPNGYFVHYDTSASGSWQLWKMTNGGQASIGAAVTGVSLNALDGMKIEAIGTTIKAFKRTGLNGSWVEVFTRTDASHTGAGYFGAFMNGAAVDDFHGGEISPESGGGIIRVVLRNALTSLSLNSLVSRVVNKTTSVALPLVPTIRSDYNRLIASALTLNTAVVRRLDRNLLGSIVLTPVISTSRSLIRAVSVALNLITDIQADIQRGAGREVFVAVTLQLVPTIGTLAPIVPRLVRWIDSVIGRGQVFDTQVEFEEFVTDPDADPRYVARTQPMKPFDSPVAVPPPVDPDAEPRYTRRSGSRGRWFGRP